MIPRDSGSGGGKINNKNPPTDIHLFQQNNKSSSESSYKLKKLTCTLTLEAFCFKV